MPPAASSELVALGREIGELNAQLRTLPELRAEVKELREKVRELERHAEKNAKRWEEYDDLPDAEPDEDRTDALLAKLAGLVQHPMAAPFRDAFMARAADKDWVNGVLDRLSPVKKG